jgi:hypothetical protein
MSDIEQQINKDHPLSMEYESDARYVWPKRFNTLLALLRERDEEIARLGEQNAKIIRGEFTQICSYCGTFEAAPPNGWKELQTHVQECQAHPLFQARQEIARLREALKPIEEVYKRADMYDNSLTCQYCTAWRAIQQAVEGMKGGNI